MAFILQANSLLSQALLRRGKSNLIEESFRLLVIKQIYGRQGSIPGGLSCKAVVLTHSPNQMELTTEIR